MSTALATLTTTKTGPKPLARLNCAVDGCTNKADHPIDMICHAHYMRMYRNWSFVATRRSPGSGTITRFGYISKGNGKDKKLEHVSKAEEAPGKELPRFAEVHHLNGIRSDNRNENLVICPSRAYHKLLHQRQKSLEACGNPNFRKCPFCKIYDDPTKMKHNVGSRYFYHTACKTKYNQSRK